MGRRILGLFLLPLDLAFAIGSALIFLVLGLLARWGKQSLRRRAAFLVPGADIQEIYHKYGTLDVYLQDDPDFFEEVHRFLWGRMNCNLWLRDNFRILERRISLPLPLQGLASLALVLVWTIWQRNIVLLHARDPYFCGLLAWLTARLTNRQFCVSIHADYDQRYKLDGPRGAPTILGSRRMAKQLERFVLSHTDMIMPIREHLAKQAVINGADPARVRIIPHGVDFSAFSRPPQGDIRAKLSIPQKKSILSFAGRLSKENYVDDIVALIKGLAASRNDFVVVMAGNGPEGRRLKFEREEDLILREHLLLPGFLPHEEVIDLRKGSNVNICLMGGFSLIEACASKRPVVTYDVEWHYELIKNRETGFLVPEGNLRELQKVVEYLLDNEDEANRMGEAARRLAIESHSLDKAAAIKRMCYEELLSKSRQRK
ncbi:MAG: glycosyltransferase family 4 protein [Candidatus Hodarchaeota archaeon]